MYIYINYVHNYATWATVEQNNVHVHDAAAKHMVNFVRIPEKF